MIETEPCPCQTSLAKTQALPDTCRMICGRALPKCECFACEIKYISNSGFAYKYMNYPALPDNQNIYSTKSKPGDKNKVINLFVTKHKT